MCEAHDYRQLAIDMTMKQVAMRAMSPEEIVVYIQELEDKLKTMARPGGAVPALVCDPSTCIREREVLCAICGHTFKVITRKHLATHGHTLASYRELCGYSKDVTLTCKQLQRTRRNNMKTHKIWERRASKSQKVEG